MNRPDNGNFTPEYATSVPLDSSQVTGRGSRKLWRSIGAALLGAVMGAAVGTLIGGAITVSPEFESVLEKVAFAGKVAGSFGLLGGVMGFAVHAAER